MQRFKKILLVSDEIKGGLALERAFALAKRNKAQLTVVAVVERLPRDYYMLITTMTSQELQDIIIKERRENLQKLIEPLKHEVAQVTTKVLTGTPFIVIIREVLQKKHDLVILTAEGRGKLKEILFGSTSLHLMRKCPCPVWVIKPTHRKQYTRILAAVDSDPYNDEERNVFNNKIMDLAISLASLDQSELHVVHAWTIYGENLLKSHPSVSQSEMDELAHDTWHGHSKQFDKLLGEYSLDNLKCQVHLLKGEAGTLIPELANKRQIDLIVMGTVCQTGMTGFFVGNTAEKVLHQVECSVLTVKPDGFVTPVMLDG